MREPEDGPAGWSAAWEAQGELVLPHRRRPLWWRAALSGLLFASSCLSLLHDLPRHDEPALYLVVRALAIPCWAGFFGYTTWQLITRRPVLRIDRGGIQYGTLARTRLSWDRVATISDPIGSWLFAFVNVRPYGGQPRRIPISHVHVSELHLFARWLRDRLEEQRRSGR